jgi:hypothetical protein
MRRLVLIVMVAAGFLTLGMSVCQRTALVNCNYKFAGVDPKVDWSDPLNPKITIDAHIEIENVNEMDVIIDRIDMDFLANSKIIFNGSPTPGDTILEDATDTVTIPMDIDYKVLGETLLELILKDSVSYELRGTIFLETEVVSDSFPITIKKGTI